MNQKAKAFGCLFILFLPFIAVGIGALGYSLYWITLSINAKNWTQVHASVHKVEQILDEMDDIPDMETIIEYGFEFNGKHYTGTRIAFQESDEYDYVYDTLTNAKTVIAFVNPKDPSQSALVPGISKNMLGILCFSIMWNSFMAIFLVPPLLRHNADENPKLSELLQMKNSSDE